MAFADPQSVTINSVAQSLPRVMTEGKKAVYQKNDQNVTLTLSHQSSKGRVRSLTRLDQRAIVADPLTSENDFGELGLQLVMDRPEYGFTLAQVQYLVAALKGWLTDDNVAKMFGQES